jgi:hypothetical protein
VLETNLAVHGVDVTVTRPSPDDTEIETQGIWLTPLTEEMPLNSGLQRHEPRRVMALSLSEVPTVPTGTLIVGPERPGGTDRTWQVDGVERREADHVRVYVVPVECD